MLLRLVVCIGMVIFCVVQGFIAAETPTESGDHYFPLVYIICSVLLLAGLNPRGLITWPISTILLLLYGHWIVGWIPLGLVLFTLLGNYVLDRAVGQNTDDT